MSAGTIRVYSTKEMVSVVCELVKRGFGFEVEDKANGEWFITLTGGF
jgi:hypothetical protein